MYCFICGCRQFAKYYDIETYARTSENTELQEVNNNNNKNNNFNSIKKLEKAKKKVFELA